MSGLELTTGLAFRSVKADAAAEIDVEWGGIAGLGRISYRVGKGGATTNRKLRFNSGANTWFFGQEAATPVDDPATTGVNEGRFHVYSTALHEVGHVVGLWHQDDRDDVMITSRLRGPNGKTSGPAFDALDDDSKRGAYALYSVPAQGVPAPPTLALGLGGLVIVRRVHGRSAADG